MKFLIDIFTYIFRTFQVDFINEKSERCRVIFKNMEEEYQQRKRKVGRKRIDSILPNVI